MPWSFWVSWQQIYIFSLTSNKPTFILVSLTYYLSDTPSYRLYWHAHTEILKGRQQAKFYDAIRMRNSIPNILPLVDLISQPRIQPVSLRVYRPQRGRGHVTAILSRLPSKIQIRQWFATNYSNSCCQVCTMHIGVFTILFLAWIWSLQLPGAYYMPSSPFKGVDNSRDGLDITYSYVLHYKNISSSFRTSNLPNNHW